MSFRRAMSRKPSVTAGLTGVDDSDTVLALYRREVLEDGFTHRTAPGDAARAVSSCGLSNAETGSRLAWQVGATDSFGVDSARRTPKIQSLGSWKKNY